MNKSQDRIPRSIVIQAYDDLDAWLKGFVEGLFSLLFLIGRPGLGKSQRVLQILEKVPHVWIDCHATKLAIYCKLYRHRNQPVVIDDENSLLIDPGKLSLMNAVCQTNPTKTLRWDSTTRILEDRKVPEEFQTTSPVLVITNRLQNLNPQVAAMIDRGQPLLFQPSTKAIHLAVADWFVDREVYNFIGDWLPAIPGLSMRDYVKAKAMKDAKMDWRFLLHKQWRTGKLARVLALKTDPAYRSEEERVAAFDASGEGSRATYYRCAKKLFEMGAVGNKKPGMVSGVISNGCSNGEFNTVSDSEDDEISEAVRIR